MISWSALQAFLVFSLLAGQSIASHTGGHRRHSKHPKPEKRIAKRGSCRASSASFSVTPTSTSSTHSTTTTSHTQTTSSSKAQPPATTPKSSSGNSGGSSNTGSSNSGGSSSGGSSSGGSSSGSDGGNIASVKAAAGFTPNGIKAGTSSGNAMSQIQSHIGWWYDWSATPKQQYSLVSVPMLWGGGYADSTDASRLAAFKQITQAPQYMLGFEEPDCPSGGGSAGMSVADGVASWEQNIAPFKAKGTKLGSPSMCKQMAETWLKEFSQQIKTDWDFTAVHINKNNMDGVRGDLDHYASYGKPLWITEFACVDDSTNFYPCTDQGEINNFINQIVDLFESDGRVAAYAYSNGEGLGNVWPMTDSSGALTESGRTYINAISKYH